MEKGKSPSQGPNLAVLSLFEWLAAIMVILVHSQRILENEALHFIQKSLFGRMAVPLFLIVSAYWFKRDWQLEATRPLAKKRLWKTLKTYLFWSLVYLPYGLAYFLSLKLPLIYAPLAVLAGLLYIGLSYQLWYIPAYLLGLALVHFLYRKIGPLKTFFILLVLYALGAVETYYAYLSPSFLTAWFDGYAHLFFTTRNGLFYSPIFIYLGYLMADYAHLAWLKAYQKSLLLLAAFLLGAEGLLIFLRQGVDKNFFFALIPFTFFLFNWILKTTWLAGKNWRHLKDLSILYFFIHPIFIELSLFVLKGWQLTKWEQGRWVFLITLVLTHLSAEGLLQWRKWVKHRRSA